MNIEELKQEIQLLKSKIETLEKYVADRKVQQISFPIDDASRVAIGMGIQGLTSDTIPTGALIVNTNQGIYKILHA